MGDSLESSECIRLAGLPAYASQDQVTALVVPFGPIRQVTLRRPRGGRIGRGGSRGGTHSGQGGGRGDGRGDGRGAGRGGGRGGHSQQNPGSDTTVEAFCTFEEQEDAAAARENLDGAEFAGLTIYASYADEEALNRDDRKAVWADADQTLAEAT
eukprot:CAMPEP_0202072588 /NCGR_PEP_ID=MMETSP0964-20121228/2513_1 /ASSEMBLY_ACC=CAM_ASM_000500 /TAXON_ID=4773 /ORGANISM="Schizochytrium aggregatum, Strain ATCC28209" /LENGTH=154 /DNA_ID=CAMNT_0048639631 /DNA_START=78 /DNA_END=542 /DNA_ORIENTATION=+